MENNEYKIVVTSLVPRAVGYDGKSGAQVRLAEILKRFSRLDGFKIVAVSSDERFFDYFQENEINFERIPIKSDLEFKSLLGLCLKSLFIIAKSFFSLKLDFLESKSENIIAYASSDLFWEVIPAYFYKKRNKNIRWIQVIHHIYPDWKARPGSKITNFFGYYLQRFSFRLIRKKADKTIVLNSIVKKNLVKLGFSGEKLALSSNGIDLKYFEDIKKEESGYDGVFLGRLSRSKGIFELIDIWKKITDDLQQAKLAIIGGGNKETKKLLAEKINEYNLKNNIDLLGFLEDKEAYSILKAGKVFLFPSFEEGWGMANAEAMACGLPVVAWNLAAYEEIYGDDIIRIGENNTDLFAKTILHLLKHDREREEIRKQGKEFVKKYSWDEVAKKELEIIKNC